MKILDKAKRRLKSRSGESITEVLVALLVSTVAIVLLAGMINSSATLIEKSRNRIDDYVAAGNALSEKGDDADAEGTVVFKTSSGDAIKLSDENASREITVEYYTNSAIPSDTLISYKVK